jgi:hypothetical protein
MAPPALRNAATSPVPSAAFVFEQEMRRVASRRVPTDRSGCPQGAAGACPLVGRRVRAGGFTRRGGKPGPPCAPCSLSAHGTLAEGRARPTRQRGRRLRRPAGPGRSAFPVSLAPSGRGGLVPRPSIVSMPVLAVSVAGHRVPGKARNAKLRCFLREQLHKSAGRADRATPVPLAPGPSPAQPRRPGPCCPLRGLPAPPRSLGVPSSLALRWAGGAPRARRGAPADGPPTQLELAK